MNIRNIYTSIQNAEIIKSNNIYDEFISIINSFIDIIDASNFIEKDKMYYVSVSVSNRLFRESDRRLNRSINLRDVIRLPYDGDGIITVKERWCADYVTCAFSLLSKLRNIEILVWIDSIDRKEKADIQISDALNLFYDTQFKQVKSLETKEIIVNNYSYLIK